jgi:tetratricopeptide (TPR) repeat protein
MGFSPAQARSALAQTQSGVDVQAALESLLTALAGSSQAPDDFGEEDRVMRERSRREEDEAERRRRRRAGPSRDSVRARTKEEVRSSTPRGESEYGEQADKIIAQASEMGQSFLKGATSFWNASKEKALRAYEEQRRAMEAGQEGRRKEVRTDGRPRWMVEAEDRDAAEAPMTRGSGGFKDSDDEEDQPRAAVMPNTGSQRRQQSHRLEKQRPTDDLLDNPRSYQPASRHPAASSSRASAIPRHATPIRQATPPPLPKRLLVDASPSQIQSSATKKTSGNEHFKLGRFPEAESAYTSAIASLPEGHLFLVPLYNNRAATRLKLGQSASAIEDCSTVIELIGPTYHPSKEAPLPDAMASEVKLGEGLIKAVMKRAQAYEMGEKWKQALEDWERVLGSDASLGGGSRGFASEGVRRAKKMLDGGEGGGSVSTRPPEISRPAKPTAPPKPVNVAKSQAVTQLRKANQAAEAEDNQRAELRETVDAKVLAWKGGKENNLRALIASLNTVLWPEILGGGLVVGMHELITDKQVKIKYMKVIARLHPDKVGSSRA